MFNAYMLRCVPLTTSAFYMRLLAVYQVGEGRSVAVVAGSLDVCPRVIYSCLRLFLRHHNPLSLKDVPIVAGLEAEPSSVTFV
jgi:hypothetical protein